MNLFDHAVVERWLEGRPASTRKVYFSVVSRFFQYSGKAYDAVTPEDLRGFQKSMMDSGKSSATIAANIKTIKSFFSFLFDTGEIQVDPSVSLRPPKVARVSKVLTHDEVDAAISAANEGRDQTLLKFLYAVGCRVSEACSITWKDIKAKPDGVAVVDILGKCDKWRSVRIPPSVWSEVQALRGDAGPLDRVFPISTRWAQEIAKNAGYKANLHSGLTPHKFRHSNASHAIEAGALLPVVRDSLGHSSIAVTDIYAHSNPEQSSSDYLGL